MIPCSGRRRGKPLAAGLAVVAALAGAPLADAGGVPLCAGTPATIVGTAGDDVLAGTIRDDVIFGGGGNDQISAAAGKDLVCGGPGADVITGEGGADILLGGGGDDRLDGDSGDDALFGGPGTDTLLGGTGADRLAGSTGGDVLEGGPGNDTLNGGPGADRLLGGDDPDRLFAGDGADFVAGGRGDDLLQGGAGADTLEGGDHNDVLAGGGDDDTLDGDAGRDLCEGGPGVDGAAACEEVRATERGQVPAPLLRPGPHQVALTFDDGPNAVYTPQILDILARYGVPATFFVVGRSAADHPQLMHRMAAEGHSVQNHTWDHAWLTRYSDASIREQLSDANDLVAEMTGATPHCLRPPFGAVNDRVRALAASEGLATIMWDVDPWNWDHPGASAVIYRVLRSTSGGDIVLFHDTGGWSTVGALPTIIETLQQRGLEIVPLCSVPGVAPS